MLIERLHFVTAPYINGIPVFKKRKELLDLINEVCLCGIKWIQLRIKKLNNKQFLSIAKEVKKITDFYNVKLIINDNVYITKEIDAFGVHLGKNDMSPVKARAILGKEKIIGISCNTFEDISKAYSLSANYIGLGPYKFTKTKKDIKPVLGIKNIEKIMSKCRKFNINIPVIAIGGINFNDIENLFNAGVSGVAVSSKIAYANNKKEIISKFTREILKYYGKINNSR